jgi:hypothetical protein
MNAVVVVDVTAIAALCSYKEPFKHLVLDVELLDKSKRRKDVESDFLQGLLVTRH